MTQLRRYATPLTIGTFLITGVTGTLWYFHIITNAGRWLHEIIGLAMMAAVVLHLVLNWRAFTTYFKRPMAIAIMAISAVALVGGYALPEAETGGGKPGMAAIKILAAKDLTTLAPLFDATGEELVLRMIEGGHASATPTSTVADLVGTDGSSVLKALETMSGK